jgi:hypothetical protein
MLPLPFIVRPTAPEMTPGVVPPNEPLPAMVIADAVVLELVIVLAVAVCE